MADEDDVLAAFDRLLADCPNKDSHHFTDATKKLSALRDQWIASARDDGNPPAKKTRLEVINGVMSALVGAHHPAHATNWERVRAARDALARLVRGDLAPSMDGPSPGAGRPGPTSA